MEGIEMDLPATPSHDGGDFITSLLSHFSATSDHHHICTVLGTMSQELTDQNLPHNPISYFGAASSSLHRLLSEPKPEPESHVIEALITIVSLLLSRLSVGILRKKKDFVEGLVFRVLKCRTSNEGSLVAGLKCAGYLLSVVGKGGSWEDVSELFGVSLGFVTHSRAKVRRQSHLCLRDTLQAFQGTPAQSSVSEGITQTFERYLLLAGGSKADAPEGPRGAQEVLYVLDALRECLPYMTMKYTTAILKYYKTLSELRQPHVTRRVTDGLNAMCLHAGAEISPDAFLDLLCTLANSVSLNETNVDNMTFIARLLASGMMKVYSLKRETCVAKLPVMFNALRDVLASEHQEAIVAATEAFKSLINSCLDEDMIKQGVEQIKIAACTNSRNSGPTTIEKVCATIESLLDYHFSAVWDMAFQIVTSTFDKLGNYSPYLLRGTLKSLADMEKLNDEDFPYRKQLHDCVGSAVVAMGPETLLSLLPLNLEADDISNIKVWLFPILKQYSAGAHLSYFNDTILGSVSFLRQKAQKLELEGRVVASRSMDALVYSLWSLFPAFCNFAADTAESFKDMEKALCNALHEEPDLHGVICGGVQLLIEQNKRVLEKRDYPLITEDCSSAERAFSLYTEQVATDNLSALRSSARGFLPALWAIFLNSMKDDGGCLQSTIHEFSSITDKGVVSTLFKRTMKELLKVTKEEAEKGWNNKSSVSMQVDSSNGNSPSTMRAKLYDLAASFLPGLSVEEIDLLFEAIKPALQDMEGMIQKKAYKVLSIILKNHEIYLSSKIKELLNLMVEVLPSCHFSAKRHRLECLYLLIVHFSKDGSEHMRPEMVTSFLTEIMLALKEANKKTRNKAYDILVQIGHAYGDEEKGGKKENLLQFFYMVAGGLAGETPHMISAAIKGLARLAYEFTDLVSAAYDVLPSSYLLLQRKNREITKANLGLLKVLVSKSQADGLQMHLKTMVEGLLKWQDNAKNHFKSKVKVLLEMLIRKCGLDAVKAVMPEEHKKLLTNIRKIKERKERKRAATSEESRSHVSKATTRLSRWNHTKIFSDFGDEETEDGDSDYMDAKTATSRKSKVSAMAKSKASLRSKRSQRAAKSLSEDLLDQYEDEPLDLLDRQKTRSALKSGQLKRKAESDDEIEIDSEGRLVVHEGEKPKKYSASEPDSDSRSEVGSQFTFGSSKNPQKRKKTSDSGWAYTGREYASKKAGGDVKRNDKLEPYAYWPLDRKMMSRRPEHRAAARKGMASVVKLTKMLEGRSASGALAFKRSKSKSGKKKAK